MDNANATQPKGRAQPEVSEPAGVSGVQPAAGVQGGDSAKAGGATETQPAATRGDEQGRPAEGVNLAGGARRGVLEKVAVPGLILLAVALVGVITYFTLLNMGVFGKEEQAQVATSETANSDKPEGLNERDSVLWDLQMLEINGGGADEELKARVEAWMETAKEEYGENSILEIDSRLMLALYYYNSGQKAAAYEYLETMANETDNNTVKAHAYGDIYYYAKKDDDIEREIAALEYLTGLPSDGIELLNAEWSGVQETYQELLKDLYKERERRIIEEIRVDNKKDEEEEEENEDEDE